MQESIRPLSSRNVLAGTVIISASSLLIVEIFPRQLQFVMAPASYLVFHNIAEFFSILVSLSMFGVGWFTYDQSKDRHALFLSTAFLAIGILDFMHTLSNASLPAFITPNSSDKSIQFWIAARLFQAAAFLASAYVFPESASRWLSKYTLLGSALLVSLLAFTGIVFFPADMPVTFIPGAGLTPFKKFSEYLVICLLCAAAAAYWRRIVRTGDRRLAYYLTAFLVCILSEFPFALYTRVFDTYNVLGHIYKVVAFYLIYYGIFAASVREPYIKLVETTAELKDRNKELQEFAFVASHDLREPLRKIQTFSTILIGKKNSQLDEQGHDYLKRMNNSAEHMDQLLQSLLGYSRVTFRAMPFTSVDLNALLREVVSDLEVTLLRTGGRVDISDLPTIDADSIQIRQLFQNLIGNSLKFRGPDPPWVRIYSAEENGNYRFFVEDNGIGFEEKYLDRIFSPFQRLHGRSEYEGTGMGLAICRKIVERHGGSITAKSEPGKGTTFIVTLPTKQPA